MDWVKEFFDTANSKIKSPVLGSILFSFCIVNWKVLFYIFFAEATVIEKFGFFNSHTTKWKLFVIPILLGVFLSWLQPRVQLWALKLTQKPLQEAKILQLRLANDRLVHKQNLEKSRRKIVAEVEEDLISQAKRDQAVLEIENNDLREKLQNLISETRNVGRSGEQTVPLGTNEKNEYNKNFQDLKEMLEFYDKRLARASQENDWDAELDLKKKRGGILKRIEALNSQRFS